VPFTVPEETPELGFGNHNVEIADARAGLSKNGNDMLIFDLIAVGEIANYPDDTPMHTAFVTVTPKTMWKVREVFEACGLELPAGGESFDERDFIGRRANVDIVDNHDGYPPKVDSWAPYVPSDVPTQDLPERGPIAKAPERAMAEAQAQADRAAEKFGDDLPWEA